MKEIDLKSIFVLLLSKARWIIVSTLVLLVLFAGYANFFQEEQYTAVAKVYVVNTKEDYEINGTTTGNLTAAQQLGDLPFQALIFLTDHIDECQLLILIAFHGAAQLLQIGAMGKGGIALGFQSRFFCCAGGHGFRNRSGSRGSFTLAAFYHGNLSTDIG